MLVVTHLQGEGWGWVVSNNHCLTLHLHLCGANSEALGSLYQDYSCLHIKFKFKKSSIIIT